MGNSLRRNKSDTENLQNTLSIFERSEDLRYNLTKKIDIAFYFEKKKFIYIYFVAVIPLCDDP